MLLIFTGYFYFDGSIGYKEQNSNFYHYGAKSQVKSYFQQLEIDRENTASSEVKKNPAFSKETWQHFIDNEYITLFEKKDVVTPEYIISETEGCFPESFQFPQKFPQAYASAYDKLIENPNYAEEIWNKYATDNGFNLTPSSHFKPLSEITGQFHWAIGSLVLLLITIFILIRTYFRSISVDENAYTSSNGIVIPYGEITQIDRRKWLNKGIAYIYYTNGQGDEKKVKLDGMVYGQFNTEQPNNAEALYSVIEKQATQATLIDYEHKEEKSV